MPRKYIPIITRSYGFSDKYTCPVSRIVSVINDNTLQANSRAELYYTGRNIAILLMGSTIDQALEI
jgi:hypothetical protein